MAAPGSIWDPLVASGTLWQHMAPCGTILFVGVLLCYFFAIPDSIFRRLGLPNRGFRMEGIAKIDFSWKSFLNNFRILF